jgi:hypothetical protein
VRYLTGLDNSLQLFNRNISSTSEKYRLLQKNIETFQKEYGVLQINTGFMQEFSGLLQLFEQVRGALAHAPLLAWQGCRETCDQTLPAPPGLSVCRFKTASRPCPPGGLAPALTLP